jgi:hypothetical protein
VLLARAQLHERGAVQPMCREETCGAPAREAARRFDAAFSTA